MAGIIEVAAMRRALGHAALGPGHGPNPRVGCVVLDSAGAIAGEGHHRGAGTPHAEVDALAAAGGAALGGTAVVTLEPCDHTGLTGPCTQALIAAGVRRVVVAGIDPNPQAAGGIAVLRAAGIEVEVGVLAEQAAALNRRWLFAVGAGRPFVTWKYAATLDGRSAAADGSSRWITGEAARADVHARRAEADAIVVGTGTVLADDPWLTVRTPASTSGDPGAAGDLGAAGGLARRQPLRVVVGRTPVPAGARVLDAAAETLLLPTRDPAEVLTALNSRQVRHVWLEGGPRLAAAFWQAGLIDEVLAYVAPTLLGAGAAAVGDLGVGTIGGAHQLELAEVRRFGDDVLLVAGPRRPHPRPDPPP